jgi:hypothetical protein
MDESDTQAWQQELENERMMVELAIVQRMERGLSTSDDAYYVARSFGLTTERNRDGNHS